MGFLNGLFKTLGFEGEKKQKSTNEIKPQLKQKNKTTAEYDLKNMEEAPVLYEPTSQVEVQNLVDKFKDGEDILVDIKNIDAKERTRSLDFFCGAVYALGGKIKQSDTTVFLFCHMENE